MEILEILEKRLKKVKNDFYLLKSENKKLKQDNELLKNANDILTRSSQDFTLSIHNTLKKEYKS